MTRTILRENLALPRPVAEDEPAAVQVPQQLPDLLGFETGAGELRREIIDHTNVVDVPEEPAGVVTTAIAAVTPPPAGTITEDLTATIAAPVTEPAPPATTSV